MKLNLWKGGEAQKENFTVLRKLPLLIKWLSYFYSPFSHFIYHNKYIIKISPVWIVVMETSFLYMKRKRIGYIFTLLFQIYASLFFPYFPKSFINFQISVEYSRQ